MRKLKTTLRALTVVALLAATPAMARQSSSITRPQLATMFANMRADAPWNVDEPLTWGYFFTSADKGALEQMARSLSAQGYRFVDLHLGDKSDPSEPNVWWLHVEKIERHTVDSLNARNQEFYALSATQSGVRYDGMDVGPAS